MDSVRLKHHVGLTIDCELYREIEALRGREKRSTFFEYLVRLGLKTYKSEKRSPASERKSIANVRST